MGQVIRLHSYPLLCYRECVLESLHGMESRCQESYNREFPSGPVPSTRARTPLRLYLSYVNASTTSIPALTDRCFDGDHRHRVMVEL